MNLPIEIAPQYQIKFIYKDGKDLNVNIEPQFLQAFFDALNAKGVYWSQDKVHGFWTNLDEVRFVQIQMIMPMVGKVEKIEPQSADSNPELPENAA